MVEIKLSCSQFLHAIELKNQRAKRLDWLAIPGFSASQNASRGIKVSCITRQLPFSITKTTPNLAITKATHIFITKATILHHQGNHLASPRQLPSSI
jgi:hypothetical protein